jgi:hypothetical protein
VSDPNQPGQISPDGRWRWDGAQWVPTGAARPMATTPRRSFAWVWWLAGGCAVLVVIAGIAAVLGLGSLVSSFQHGGFSCLPSDFPTYPGATVSSENTYVGTGVPAGDTKRCTMTLESNDDVNTVTSWYSSNLDSGDWSASSNTPSGTIQFENRSKPSTNGSIELLGHGQQTEIRITLYS